MNVRGYQEDATRTCASKNDFRKILFRCLGLLQHIKDKGKISDMSINGKLSKFLMEE